MSIHRTLFTLAVVPTALAVGLFACGGKVAEDEPRDAGATPGSGGTSTSTASGGGGSSGSGGGTATTPTTDPTPSTTTTDAPGVSPTAITVSTADCAARPNTCAGLGGGVVDDIVARWVGVIVDDCEHPKTGIPPAFPACGTIDLKFARTADGGGCAQTATFDAPQSMSFAACVATALANQRCVPGLFLSGDEGKFALCPK